MQTETRTFVGQTGTKVFDGYAGFRIGRTYPLRFTRLSDGTVAVELDHAPAGGQLVVQEAEFEKWWVKR